VRAAADGEVTFAGQVGGSHHVVVLHADGLRTSYSFLDTVAVHRGDHVVQGDVVGTSRDTNNIARPFLWRDGQLQDLVAYLDGLRSPSPSGRTASGAVAVSSR